MTQYFHAIGATFLLLASQSVTARNAEDPRRVEGPARITKSAWEWTTEERLAERFNPSRIQERELAYETRFPRAAGSSRRAKTESFSSDGRQPVVSGIDGTRNPELFLPYELFDALMTGFEPDESLRAGQRAYMREAIRKLGYDDDQFWISLGAVSEGYIPWRFGKLEKTNREACRQRYDALEAARAFFGRTKFDVLLYTVVAPTLQHSETTFDPDPAAKHRRAEAGCR